MREKWRGYVFKDKRIGRIRESEWRRVEEDEKER